MSSILIVPNLIGYEKNKRQTKIIATVGPATAKSMAEIIKEGVDVLRLNMAHAEHAWIRMITERIRLWANNLEENPP